MPLPVKIARLLLLLTAFSEARSQCLRDFAASPSPDYLAVPASSIAESSPSVIESSGPDEASAPDESSGPDKSSTADKQYPWLDSVQNTVYNTLWRTAMHVDRWFGSQEPESAYQQISGSIAPALLWDQYSGFRHLLRFHADVPLPQINERFHAFIGRVNPEEFISESQPASGAFANPFAPAPQDQTLLGLQYQEPVRQGASWDAGVGLPVRLPFDPYLKGGYVYARGRPEQGVLSWRQDLFYRDSQGGFGLTNRLDLQRLVGERLLLGWTGSTTMAQRSHGWRSYSTLDAILALGERRALDLQLSIDGVTRAPVALHDYGAKLAYRRSILREWLVLEVRTSVDWPKDYVWQQRKASWGLGVGFEMYFGHSRFQARSATF